MITDVKKIFPKSLNYRKRLQRLLIPKTCPHEITVVSHVHLCLFLFLSFFSSLTLFSHVSLSFHVCLFSCLSLCPLNALYVVCCCTYSHHARKSSKDSCASLVPLGMKWACMCAEKRMCLVWCGVMCLYCVFVPVAM